MLMPEQEEFLDIDQAAEYLGLGKSTLWLYVKRYNIPKYKRPIHGRKTLFRKEDLDTLKTPRLKEGPEGKEAA